MEIFEIILLFLAMMIALVALAHRIRIAYPILLIVAGLIIGFIPGIPHIELEPDLVFILFLPPILQLAAYNTSLRDFRANARAIGLLAIGLVLATMVVVAVVAHYVIEGLPWSAAFVLGAIVAPPDAVAATSIAQRLNLPRRIVTVIEGESLVNDATALVSYRVAVVAVVTGTFSLWNASGQFLFSAFGGVLIGVLAGVLLPVLFRFLQEDVSIYVILTFLSGYGVYILAESVHVSGVLGVVALGLISSQPRFNTMTPQLRVEAGVIWDSVVFLLNGLLFILIGLQLRNIVDEVRNESILTLFWYAVAICLTVVIVRILWVIPGTYLPRLPARIRERDPFPPWQQVAIVAWTGMRGMVSLASALALPLTTMAGAPFPHRGLIIFLAFSVIFATLVLQGLSLPFLIRKLGIKDDGSSEREEQKARLVAARAGMAYLDKEIEKGELSSEVAQRFHRLYEARIRRFSARHQGQPDEVVEKHFAARESLRRKLLDVEMAEVVELRNRQVINDEVMRRVQYELDLEWLRLQLEESQEDSSS